MKALKHKFSFGLDDGVKKQIVENIAETISVFGNSYQAAFRVELVKKVMADGAKQAESKAGHDKKEAVRQLLSIPGALVPEKRGFVERQSTVMKRWKKQYAYVKENFDVGLSSAPDKPEEATINLWGYSVEALARKFKGKHRGGPEWVADDSRSSCKQCDKVFTAVHRRHHCRHCGELFCGDCTEGQVSLTHFGYEGPERVCGPCYETVMSRSRGQSVAVTPQLTNVAESKGAEVFYGIHLLHPSRIPYVLACDTEKDRDEWLGALHVCASNASPPRNPNPVMAAAFESAHKASSAKLGIKGAWALTGTEPEMLTDLITHNLVEHVVKDAISHLLSRIPEKYQKKAFGLAKRQIQIMVAVVTGPAWKKIVEMVDKLQKPTEEKLAPVLGNVEKARVEIKHKIKSGVTQTLEPILEKLGAPVLDIILQFAVAPVIQMHTKASGVFKAECTAIGQRVSTASGDKKATLAAEVKTAMKNVRGEFGAMHDIYEASRALAKEFRELRKKYSQLSHVNVNRFVGQVLSSVHTLLNQALYTLSVDAILLERVADGGDVEKAVATAWNTTEKKLMNDSQLEIRETFKQLLTAIVVAPVLEAVRESAVVAAVTEPLEAAIPEIAKEFISIVDTRDEIVTETVQELVAHAVDNGKSSSISKFAEAFASV